jgi:transglutaminase-like putative cysteine protease
MIASARLVSHGMAAVGLASLASTGQISLWLLIVGGVGVLTSLGLDVLRWPRTPPAAFSNALIFAALGGAVIDYLWISSTLLHVGAHLLIVLMLTRLRHADSREYLQLVVIVFLQILAAAGLTSRSTFAVGFVAYLIVMIWVLMHYHLMEEAERSGTRPAGGVSARGTGRCALAASGAALIITGALFVFLPRLGFGLLAAVPPPDVRLSGFSPHVTLGAIGPVKRDPTVVMRVSRGDLLPGIDSLYLRGAAFDAYDGRSWQNTEPVRRLLPLDSEGRFTLGRVPPRSVRYTVRLEPIDAPVLFTPSRTVAVAGPFPSVSVDDYQTFGVSYPARARLTYDIWQRPLGGPSPTSDESATRWTRYLRTDGSPSIARLAREAAGDSTTPHDRAKAVERFLRTRYTYTLDVPGGEDRPVEEFLFRRRSGFCEHFATAMVLMTRALGIPARLVNGFLVQEWNEYGEYFIVRQGDAHAWVEAYLPEQGWTRFDPTPAAPASDRPWEGPFQHYLDSLRTGWDRYVVEFGLGDQSDALQQIEAAWEGTRVAAAAQLDRMADGWRALRSVRAGAWGAAAVALAALLVAIAVLTRRRPWRRRHTPRLPAPRVDFYARLLAALTRKGITRSPGVTPWEFATRDASRLPWAAEIRQLTGYYYDVRYGRRPLGSAERRAITTALEAIERSANTPAF